MLAATRVGVHIYDASESPISGLLAAAASAYRSRTHSIIIIIIAIDNIKVLRY